MFVYSFILSIFNLTPRLAKPSFRFMQVLGGLSSNLLVSNLFERIIQFLYLLFFWARSFVNNSSNKAIVSFLLLHFLSSSNVGALHCKFSKGPQHQENLSDSANEQVDSSLEAMECLTTSVKTNTTSSNRISKCNPSPVVKVIYHYKRAKEFY